MEALWVNRSKTQTVTISIEGLDFNYPTTFGIFFSYLLDGVLCQKKVTPDWVSGGSWYRQHFTIKLDELIDVFMVKPGTSYDEPARRLRLCVGIGVGSNYQNIDTIGEYFYWGNYISFKANKLTYTMPVQQITSKSTAMSVSMSTVLGLQGEALLAESINYCHGSISIDAAYTDITLDAGIWVSGTLVKPLGGITLTTTAAETVYFVAGSSPVPNRRTTQGVFFSFQQLDKNDLDNFKITLRNAGGTSAFGTSYVNFIPYNWSSY